MGHPGTILTFFHWPNIPKGHRGTGEVSAASFLIPENSINYWIDRFKDKEIELEIYENNPDQTLYNIYVKRNANGDDE